MSSFLVAFLVLFGILVRRSCLSGSVEEQVMRKKHAANEVVNKTVCGHEATPQEYQNMKVRKLVQVNCQRCLSTLGAT